MNKVVFRKIRNEISFRKTIGFLTEDVNKSGGSASEIVDIHNNLVLLTVCRNVGLDRNLVPVNNGTILIYKEVSKIEALAWFADGEFSKDNE